MENNWNLALFWQDLSPWRESGRDHWWRFSLICSRSTRTEEIMERRWELAPCDRIRVPKESPGEVIGEGAAKWLGRHQHFGDARWCDQGYQQPGNGADLSPREHCLICGKPVGAQKIMSESQKSDSEPYMVGLWFCIVIVPWFFPLGVRKDLNYFLFYRSPQLRGVGILERLNSYSVWISKDWDFSKLE